MLTLGWREWVSLPDLGIDRIKAKLDTGARSSALHVVSLETYERDGTPWVRFAADPDAESNAVIEVECPMHDERLVRASNGQQEMRVIVRTRMSAANLHWPIDLSLARREEMKFRMLVGREALAGRIRVDPARSYLATGRTPAIPDDEEE